MTSTTDPRPSRDERNTELRRIAKRVLGFPLEGRVGLHVYFLLKYSRPDAVRRLWRALNHPATLENLAFAGKSYGGGALKVEPRQLDRLEIPLSVLKEVGMESPPVATELFLLEDAGRPTQPLRTGKRRSQSRRTA